MLTLFILRSNCRISQGSLKHHIVLLNLQYLSHQRYDRRNHVSVFLSKNFGVTCLTNTTRRGSSRTHAGAFLFRCLFGLSILYPKTQATLAVISSRPTHRIARFSNVQHLSIHISKNFGEENTRVYFIGLRGEYSEVSGGKAPCTSTQGEAES